MRLLKAKELPNSVISDLIVIFTGGQLTVYDEWKCAIGCAYSLDWG